MTEEMVPEMENNSDNSSENIQEQEAEKEEKEVVVHPFDRMFFGGSATQNRRPLFDRPIQQNESTHEMQNNNNDVLANILNHPTLKNIDLNEMMNHVDNLMTSLGELKPMFQKVSPLISKFIQSSKE